MSMTSLALANCLHAPWRSAALAFLAALACIASFLGPVLDNAARECADISSGRLGADAILVPYGYEGKMEGAILRGEPSAAYLDGKLADEARSDPGIVRATPQLFLASLQASCCDVPVQIIGFDPATDFVVRPWLAEGTKAPDDGEIVIGSRVGSREDGTIRLFGRDLKVVGRLAKTGLGLDSSVLMEIGFARRLLLTSALAKRLNIPENVSRDRLASSIMIDVKDGEDKKPVINRLLRNHSREYACSALTASSLLSGTARQLAAFAHIVGAFGAFAWISALAAAAASFSMSLAMRSREFAGLRLAGASIFQCLRIAATEALLTGFCGSLAGLLLAWSAAALFAPWLAQAFQLPQAALDAAVPMPTALRALFAGTLVLPLSCFFAAWPAFSKEAYLAGKEGT